MMPTDIHERLNSIQRYALLLARAKDREPIRGKLWFQKEMFLLSKGSPVLEGELEYEPSLMGAMSDALELNLDQLESIGLLDKSGSAFVLTDPGDQCVLKVIPELTTSELNRIEEVKGLLNDLSKDELLAFLYFIYPEMTEESEELAGLEPERRGLAVRLFKKGKVGLEKGAVVAGLSVQEFASLLRRRGVHRYSE